MPARAPAVGTSVTTLSDRLDALLGYFNRGLLDVPDGLLDHNAAFSLNGVPYATWLGRSADDPLVRLITRGTAGYRFVAQTVLRALPGARATRRDLVPGHESATTVLSVNGILRGTKDAVTAEIALCLWVNASGVVTGADLQLAEGLMAKLQEARGRE